MQAADQIGGRSSSLGREVHAFLAVMACGDEAERRAYQRIPGHGCRAAFQPPGGAAAEAEIRDISRGGIGLLTSCHAEPGSPAEIRLPGTRMAVPGRVVRCKDGVAVFAFRQDPEVLAAVDQALAAIAGTGAELRYG